MVKVDDVFEQDVIDKLKAITADNGYDYTVCVLDGALRFYVSDLVDPDSFDYFFPCVSARLGDDSVKASSDYRRSTVTRRVIINGAVDSLDRTTVNSQLNSLVLNVRKALSVDPYEGSSVASHVEIGGATYDDPDPSDRYSSFEMVITLVYNESWEAP